METFADTDLPDPAWAQLAVHIRAEEYYSECGGQCRTLK
jgi:hypothetical protein